MTDRNEFNAYEAEYNTKKKKGHGVLRTLGLMFSCGVISLACGLGGGYYAVTHFTGNASDDNTLSITASSQPAVSSTTAVSSGKQMTMTEAVAKAAPSVVEINVKGTTTTYGFFGGTYETESAGSGVIISSDGYIITNNHVVDGGNTYTITTYDGVSYEAELIGTDEKTDIAVLKVDAQDMCAAVIGDSERLSAGDTAIAIGNPLGTLGGTVTDGIISSTSRDLVINDEAMTVIQTNAQINSGNSGGGLFDGNGNLIGIVNAKDSGSTSSGTSIEGLGFAIPINTAIDVAEQLITYGEVTNRASLGVQLQEVTRATANYPKGLYIVGVLEGSGAQIAGLAKYDRIVTVDGTEVSSYTDLSAILNKKKVGDTVTVEIVRNGETEFVDVTLGGSAAVSTGE